MFTTSGVVSMTSGAVAITAGSVTGGATISGSDGVSAGTGLISNFCSVWPQFGQNANFSANPSSQELQNLTIFPILASQYERSNHGRYNDDTLYHRDFQKKSEFR
jgi:hypothetical protein